MEIPSDGIAAAIAGPIIPSLNNLVPFLKNEKKLLILTTEVLYFLSDSPTILTLFLSLVTVSFNKEVVDTYVFFSFSIIDVFLIDKVF